jgi:hypothetical protein
MSPREYIFNWFQRNQKKLQFNKIQYSFHDYSETHFIYCEPSVDSLSNESRDLLTELILSFEKLYKDQQIGILDSTSLSRLDNPESFIDTNYSEVNSYYNQFELKISENYLQQLTFNEPLQSYVYSDNYKVLLPGEISLNQYTLKHFNSGIITTPSIFFELMTPPYKKSNELIIYDNENNSIAA